MSFIVYDIIFLALFVLAVILFLYIKRKNVKRQGLLYLYPTKVGINIINSTAKKYEKILRPMQYVIIACGYFLMVFMIWLFGRFTYTYLTSPTIAAELKLPVVTPLVPYIDQLIGSSYFPPLYFTYWIILIAVLAIPHEFAHGIFARLNKIKVHSTGFGFLGPFLAAFVEPDEKQISTSSKRSQLAILAAGTFANVLATILFALLIWAFFALAFTSGGVYFTSYAGGYANMTDISQSATYGGIPIMAVSSIIPPEKIIEVQWNNTTYYTTYGAYQYSIQNNLSYVYVYEDTPAFRARLSGAISEIDGVKITGYEQFKEELLSKSPGQNITLTTITQNGTQTYNLALAERDGMPYLGIARADVSQISSRGLASSLSTSFYRMMDPLKYNQYFNGLAYESRFGEFGLFIYNLLWWLVLVNLSVALVNMLPLGIFDGGRFFMLTIWGLTGSKKAGEVAFKFSTWILLGIIVLLMLKWALIFV